MRLLRHILAWAALAAIARTDVGATDVGASRFIIFQDMDFELLDLNDSSVVTITDDAIPVSGNPNFSPDGQYVLFSRQEYRPLPALYVMSRNGTGKRSLFDGTVGAFGAWSRQGMTAVSIAKDPCSCACDCTTSVQILDVEGHAHRTFELPHKPLFLQWLPSGSQLLYTDRDYVWLVGQAGSSEQRLTDTVPGTIFVHFLRVSPRGDLAVIARARRPTAEQMRQHQRGPGSFVSLLNLGNGKETPLMDNVALGVKPWLDWTSDGQTVLFMNQVDSHIHSIHFSGTAPVDISVCPTEAREFVCFTPDVSADGRTLAYVLRDGQKGEFFLALTDLESGLCRFLQPDLLAWWRPDAEPPRILAFY
jgi:Tol biopolymer transport system component